MPGEWREIVAEWKGESSFIARNPSGGTVQMGTIDGNPGVGPMQLLLAGLAGCSGMDVASILQKKRQQLEDLKIQVRARMREEYPRVFTEIEVIFLVWGTNLDPNAIEQAIQLSEEKYCSVGAMLKVTAPIRYRYHILSPGEQYEVKEEAVK